MSIVLVTGGVRSGKSAYAEQLATERGGHSVLYVATGLAIDHEMEQRIGIHRDRRPRSWGCLESPSDLLADLSEYNKYDAVMMDCLSTWVTNRVVQVPEPQIRDVHETETILRHYREWLQQIGQLQCPIIIVTNEVGLGGVLMSSLGRWFQDVLGSANQLTAQAADEVYMVVSGIPWRIK